MKAQDFCANHKTDGFEDVETTFVRGCSRGSVPAKGSFLCFDSGDCLISNPFLSECGTFAVNPTVAYGLNIAVANAQYRENCRRASEAARQPALVG